MEGQGAGRAAQPLALMAAKSWLGHAESGAGMAGVAHAALSLANADVLGISHLRELNPYVVSTLRTPGPPVWAVPRQTSVLPGTRGREAALCGVSSFAFQGTNAHAVLQTVNGQPSPRRPAAATRAPVMSLAAPAGATLVTTFPRESTKMFAT